MFSQLRPNSTIYVLFRNSPVRVEQAVVEQATSNQPKFAPTFGTQMDATMDLTIRIGEERQTFQRIPSNSDSATFLAQNLTICTSREAVNNEIGSIRRTSEEHVSAYEQHRRTIEECDALFLRMNPEIEEKKRQDELIAKLYQSVDALSRKVDELSKTNRQKAENMKNNP